MTAYIWPFHFTFMCVCVCVFLVFLNWLLRWCPYHCTIQNMHNDVYLLKFNWLWHSHPPHTPYIVFLNWIHLTKQKPSTIELFPITNKRQMHHFTQITLFNQFPLLSIQSLRNEKINREIEWILMHTARNYTQFVFISNQICLNNSTQMKFSVL